ncbi:MAG: HNH endonuclease [Phage 5P_3]|nr:MAG: HNH endonuclease [Phage 5P_3]
MQCDQCGAQFEPSNYRGDRQRFCSDKCRRKWQSHHQTFVKGVVCTCKNCGETFHPKRSDRVSFCSRECAFAYKSAHAEKKQIEQSESYFCVICGSQMLDDRASVCCSDECRKERARRESRKYSERQKKTEPVLCGECGKPFIPEYGSKRRRFCSTECCIRASRRVARGNRRARQRAAFVESIDPMTVFIRDNWVCQICGAVIDPDVRFPHIMCATVDHIIPLARGGTHEYKNVQAAHFICNSIKSDTL